MSNRNKNKMKNQMMLKKKAATVEAIPIALNPGKKRDKVFWEELYRDQAVEVMPWFTPRLDHDIAKVVQKIKNGSISLLDLGTGPGTQAIALAKQGFKVTASDISPSAVVKAKQRAKKEGCHITFRCDDILKTKLKSKFDLILDRGCFHTLVPSDRARYIRNVKKLLKRGGCLILKCFSYKERYDKGPFRFKPEEIRKLFNQTFMVESVRESVFRSVRKPNPKALFCIIKNDPHVS